MINWRLKVLESFMPKFVIDKWKYLLYPNFRMNEQTKALKGLQKSVNECCNLVVKQYDVIQ